MALVGKNLAPFAEGLVGRDEQQESPPILGVRAACEAGQESPVEIEVLGTLKGLDAEGNGRARIDAPGAARRWAIAGPLINSGPFVDNKTGRIRFPRKGDNPEAFEV